MTRDEEETLLDEKIQNHSKVNFRDFQLLIEMGEEFVLNSEEKNTKLSERATTRK